MPTAIILRRRFSAPRGCLHLLRAFDLWPPPPPPRKAAKPQIRQTQLLINGQWTPARSGKTFDTINPATEEVIAQVAEADAADVEMAVRAARQAFDDGPWPRMDARERGRIMMRLADLMEAEIDEFAALESLDNGKPVSDAKLGDIPLAISVLRYYAGWADKIQGADDPDQWQLLLLHAEGAGRRGRPDHPLELSDPDGVVEVGPGPGRRLHGRDEAG